MDTGATATRLEQNWMEILCDPEFAGYSIMALSQCCDPQLLALGSLHGRIKLLSIAHKGLWSVILIFLLKNQLCRYTSFVYNK